MKFEWHTQKYSSCGGGGDDGDDVKGDDVVNDKGWEWLLLL